MELQEATARSLRRRKACLPCTRAKRRCDKKLPSCQRCMGKDALCQYPSTRPYARRQEIAADFLSFGLTQEANDDALGTAACSDNDENENENENDMEPPVSTLGGSREPDAASSWFLQNETWAIHPTANSNPQPGIRISALKHFVRGVRTWLQQWVDENQCPFMHRQLFADTGLPPCLQDAYATLTTYAAKNDRNEHVVMHVVQEKADALLRQQPDNDLSLYCTIAAPLVPTVEQLARVQALFIYQFIRLFDGDIRQRAQAERHMPTLSGWITQLWGSANLGASLQTTFGDGGLFAQHPGSAAAGHDATAMLWRDWVLAESVRRIWIVGNYMQGVYLTLRDGHGACAGSIAFTARRGLWDAASAAAWLSLVKSRDPLFVPCYETDRLITTTPALGIDVFGLSVMSIVWNSDMVDSWVAKSSDTHLQALIVDEVNRSGGVDEVGWDSPRRRRR